MDCELYLVTFDDDTLRQYSDTDFAIIKDRVKRSFEGFYWISKYSCFVKSEINTAKEIYNKILGNDYSHVRVVIAKIESPSTKTLWGVNSSNLWMDFLGIVKDTK